MGNKRVDPFYGKNVWPDEALKCKFTAVNEAMYEATLRVLRGCDQFLERDHGPLPAGRLSLEQISTEGTTLAGRWIWYDSRYISVTSPLLVALTLTLPQSPALTQP